MAKGYQGIANHLPNLFQITLKGRTSDFSPQQEIRNCKIELLVDIPGFVCIDLKHHWPLANPVVPLDQVFAGEEIETRVLLVNWRQVLGLDEDCRVVVDRASI